MRDFETSRGAMPPRSLARDAAHLLWFYLRGRQLADCEFRRRHVIGHETADFVCLDRRLCLVIDAGEADVARRASQLKARGFRVRRLEFVRVFEETESVLDEISEALEDERPLHGGRRQSSGRRASRTGGCDGIRVGTSRDM
jgi:very-short-patch-repair endonuclease